MRTDGAKRSLVLVLLACVIAVSQAGCSAVSASQREAPELLKPAKKQEDLYEVRKGNLVQQLQGPGVFVPGDTLFQQYATAGKVDAVYVKQGDTVRKGDVLMELDATDLNQKLVNQRLVVAEAEDKLEQTKQTYDADLLRLAALNAQVEQMKLDNLELKLGKLKLRAERDGVITFIDFVKQGDNVTAYKDIVGISDPKSLQFMYVGARNNDLYNIEKGIPVQIAYGGSTYAGKVIQSPRYAPTARSAFETERNARTLLIELDSQPADAAFGAQAEMTIVLAQRDDVMIIPRVGLRSYQGNTFVRIKDGDTHTEVDVVKGIETATEVEIRSGLSVGQQLILNN